MHILGRVTYQKHGCQRRHSWHYARASTLIQLMCLVVAEQARVSSSLHRYAAANQLRCGARV